MTVRECEKRYIPAMIRVWNKAADADNIAARRLYERLGGAKLQN